MAQKALSFITDDKVNCGNPASLTNLHDGAFTVEAWIKKGSNVGSDIIVSKYDESPIEGWRLFVNGDKLRAYIRCATTIADSLSVETIPTGSWVYVGMTFDDAGDRKIRLFINGSEVTYGTQTAGVGAIKTDNNTEFWIGEDYDASGRPFDGVIDEVRISTKIRTPAEISAIWNGGNGKRFEVDGDTVALWHMDEGADSTIYDETNNNNDGTITGASWVDGYPFQFAQFLSLVSIPSAEAFGALIVVPGAVSILPAAIASLEAFGALTVVPGAVSILPAAIGSLEAFGSAKLNLKLLLTAIASAEALGIPIVTSGLRLYPTGIASVEAFGSLVIAGPLIVPGIGSQEALGSPTVSPGGVIVAPGGISSQELFGLPKLNLLLTPSGIVSSEAFGAAKLNLKLILTAIASGEQFGTPTVKMILVIRPSGIASVEAFGIPILIVILAKGTDMKLPQGIPGETAPPPGQTSIPSGRVSLPWE